MAQKSNNTAQENNKPTIDRRRLEEIVAIDREGKYVIGREGISVLVQAASAYLELTAQKKEPDNEAKRKALDWFNGFLNEKVEDAHGSINGGIKEADFIDDEIVKAIRASLM